jgi:SAM-dependent methyltransferase
MHINSRLLFKKFAKELFKPGTRVLEIGPDKNPSTFNEIVGINSIDWQTLDIHPGVNLTYLAKTEYSFSIADNTFDIVFSGQVIEHVRKPWIWMKELARVCKTGGQVITINPVSWPYHEAPIDCWRIFPEGMRALYEEAGLRVLLCKMESLEPMRSRRAIAGAGAVDGKADLTLKSIIKKMIGWPVSRSIDVITIGIKY